MARPISTSLLLDIRFSQESFCHEGTRTIENIISPSDKLPFLSLSRIVTYIFRNRPLLQQGSRPMELDLIALICSASVIVITGLYVGWTRLGAEKFES